MQLPLEHKVNKWTNCGVSLIGGCLHLANIVDPSVVQENVEGDQTNAKIGVACSAELPRERLDTSDATQLRRIRKKHTEQHWHVKLVMFLM
ncbi:hypothetical protein DVH24_013845 [Malus domestica]|uniref:Uncharacterized protein n=1 Tax=Malus domestica TaxID=3750 RepID=A0A498JBU5_MALDO|nr:hypothetical protein DVH24_013845 [Malus domestica]